MIASETIRDEATLDAECMAAVEGACSGALADAGPKRSDWRGPDVLAVPRPVCPPKPAAPRPQTACRTFIGCGFSFCDACGGNDFYDIPFTCKPGSPAEERNHGKA